MGPDVYAISRREEQWSIEPWSTASLSGYAAHAAVKETQPLACLAPVIR